MAQPKSRFFAVDTSGNRTNGQQLANKSSKCGTTNRFLLKFLNSTQKNTAFSVMQNSMPVPQNLVVQHFGAICKVELQMQKQLKLPIFIRMGSKEQVDYLEGKFVK